MCIHLFNPPAPNCDSNRGCGRCTCVPRFQQVSGKVQGAQRANYEQLFMAPHILRRDQTAARDPFTPFPCRWYSPIADPGPGIHIGDSFGIAVGYDQSNGTAGSPTWYCILSGLTDPGNPQDFMVYSQVAFGFPRPIWRCLSPNVLYRDDISSNNHSFLDMPDQLDIVPFWP